MKLDDLRKKALEGIKRPSKVIEPNKRLRIREKARLWRNEHWTLTVESTLMRCRCSAVIVTTLNSPICPVCGRDHYKHCEACGMPFVDNGTLCKKCSASGLPTGFHRQFEGHNRQFAPTPNPEEIKVILDNKFNELQKRAKKSKEKP